MAMQTVSVRIPSEDLEWLATFEIQGATTPSDKLRALVTHARREQEGAADYEATLARMRDLVGPFVTRIGAIEHRQGNHSEVVRLITEWLPPTMAVLIAESGSTSPQARMLQQLEERLVTRIFQLITAVLRLGVTQTADCYDPRVLEKYLPQVIELANVIATNRPSAQRTENDHG